MIALEGGLTVIVVALAFLAPRLAGTWFTRIEQLGTRLAYRRHLSVFVVGLSALLLRLAILPVCPIPLPFVPDDFSFLLSADTFAHGRLTNPTPAMWIHFETIHVSMLPSYMSMYFPAQGLILAAGQVLFGHPWYGLLIASALMCAALCWMLQAWLPATWALVGGMLAVLHFALYSYWINTYHAAGSIGALGGALVIGSMPRLIKTGSTRYGVLMAVGIVCLILTRPYEGMLLCLPVAFMLGRWILKGKTCPPGKVLLRRAIPALLVLVIGAGWLAHYDKVAFGKATTLPYTVNRAQYAMAPYFIWQAPRPEPAYHHQVMRAFYYEGELKFLNLERTRSGFLPHTLGKTAWAIQFFTGLALIPPFIMLRRTFLDRRTRFLVLSLSLLAAGMIIQIFLLPHYLAPFVATFYAIGLQAMRHLWVWKANGQPVGKTIVRLLVTVCVVVAALRLAPGPLRLALPEWPAAYWNFMWYGPDHFGTERARVLTDLEKQPGRQLVLVRYQPKHNPFNEWVYNSADLDNAKVIWAREMTPEQNVELLKYYKDRQVWLAQPDKNPVLLTPYSISSQEFAALR